MEMFIKKMFIENFKGISNLEIDFETANKICGRNGVGKTTIATAFYWVLFDKDYDLKSNPQVRTIGSEELTPVVTLVLDLDGREATVAKSQKRTVSKPNVDGISRISLSNTYEINGVPKAEKDFKAFLEACGFDFEHALACCHPEVFTGRKADEMRKVLFGMGMVKSDKEIADSLGDNARNVAALLDSYKAEEIKAMQSATLRKINTEYGKAGEILDAKIEGLLNGKVDVDVAELELERAAINEERQNLAARIADVDAKNKEFTEKIDKMYAAERELRKEAQDIVIQYEGDFEDSIRELKDAKKAASEKLSEAYEAVSGYTRKISSVQRSIEEGKKDLESVKQRYKDETARTFDENSLVCPYCGQSLPEERRNKIVADFEKKKADAVSRIKSQGDSLNEQIKQDTGLLKSYEESLAKYEAEKETALEAEELANKNLEDALANKKDATTFPEYIDLITRADGIKASASGVLPESNRELLAKDMELTNRVMEISKRIGAADNNIRIDEQADAMREMKLKYEQSRADAEEILYELDMLSKAKNELLTDAINSHFNIVKFVMFDYLKNGSYTDVCIPTIDGRRLGESTNTAREVLAKLDIVCGLQNYYGMHLPVFLDGSEALSSDSIIRIDADSYQLISLKVTEDPELKFI